MSHVLLLAPLPPELLTGALPDLDVRVPTSQAAAVEQASGALACIASWSADGLLVDADVAAALAPTCRLVQVPAAGLDGIDLEALHGHGIPVASARGLNAGSVAEWCVWAILDALRGLADAHAALGRGEWLMFAPRARHELAGRRVGIVGMGEIGRALVPRLGGFDVEVAYANRSAKPAVEETFGIERMSVDELVARSDVLVLAVASTDQTRGLLSAERLAALPPNAVVVNAARGEVWDEAAVAAAVAADGGLLAAATDVFTDEPPTPDHPLIGLDGVTTTPHVAGPSAEVLGRIMQRTLANVAAVVAGSGEPSGLVGPPD